MKEEKVKINNKEEARERVQEIKEDLPKNQRLVEIQPGEFKTLTRMNG